eukprot:jgi/Botrbrau1/3482/Bobra.341_2s0013.1
MRHSMAHNYHYGAIVMPASYVDAKSRMDACKYVVKLHHILTYVMNGYPYGYHYLYSDLVEIPLKSSTKLYAPVLAIVGRLNV